MTRLTTTLVYLLVALILAIPVLHGVRPAQEGMVWDLGGIPENLTYDEAAAMARYLDYLQELAGPAPSQPTTAHLHAWATLLIPMYEYEGAAGAVRLPQSIRFNWYGAQSGQRHNHVGGSSDCQSYVIINARMALPIDTWYLEGNYVATLAHELLHLHQQGGCNWARMTPRGIEILENTAELASWEILAALANGGNHDAARALIDAMLGRAMGAARELAFQEGRESDYDALRAGLSPGAEMQARRDRNDRYWLGTAARKAQLRGILRSYALGPVQRLTAAWGNDGLATDLILDIGQSRAGGYLADLQLDDLIYFLDHAPDIIRAWPETGQQFEK